MSAPALCVLGSLILFSACSSTVEVRRPAQASSRTVRADRVAESRPLFPLFPPASGDLVLESPASGGAPSMLDLVLRYGELTGQTIAYSPQFAEQTRAMLAADKLPIENLTRVPAAEVQSFVESMLTGEYLLSLGSTETPRVVFVHALNSPARSFMRTQSITLPSADVDKARAHPTVLFTTLVELPRTDVRTLSNSMRPLIFDPNLLTIIPVGNSMLLMMGLGTELASLVDHVREIDAGQTQPVFHNELVRLTQAQAAQVAPLVQKAFPGSVVQAYEDMNALVITCPEDVQAQVRALIAELDTEL